MIEAITIYVALAVLIVIVEVRRSRRLKYDFLFFFNISFLVYYSLAPLHLLIGGNDYATLPNIYRQYLSGDGAAMLTIRMAGLIALAYGFTLFGFYLPRLVSFGCDVSMQPPTERACKAVIVFTLVFGCCCFVLYMLQFQSALDAIAKAAVIVMGDEPDAGRLAFLRDLVPLAAVAAPLTLAFLLEKHECLDTRHRLLIGLLLIIGALALLTQGSRRANMILALELYFLLANVRQRLYAGWLVVVAMVALVLVVFGDILSMGLALGIDFASTETTGILRENLGALYASIWRNFTYTFQSLVAVVERYEGLPRLFVDVPFVFIDLIPERLLPLALPPTLANDSTLLITEIPVPLIAEVPPGYVGFLWYSGYLPGIVIGATLYGLLGRALEHFLLPGPRASPTMILLCTWAGFCWGYFLREGIPTMIVVDRLHWIIVTLLFLLLGGFVVRIPQESGVLRPRQS